MIEKTFKAIDENLDDVNAFLEKMMESGASPLLAVSGGIHLHTVEVMDKESLQEIRAGLEQEGILIE